MFLLLEYASGSLFLAFSGDSVSEEDSDEFEVDRRLTIHEEILLNGSSVDDDAATCFGLSAAFDAASSKLGKAKYVNY